MTAPAPPPSPFSWHGKRALVTGGAGFLGSAVCLALRARGVPSDHLLIPRSRECDLRDRTAVRAMLDAARPDIVIHAAATVGGIQANRDRPGEFFHDNMAMALNVIDECRRARADGRGPEVVVQIGSMTSYPAAATPPFREEMLGAGLPEASVAPYGIAKLAAWQMLVAYHRQYGLPSAYLVPVNLYGPGDNIDDVRNAHVAGSLVKRFVDATTTGADEVVCWGTGAPTRQFVFVDDAAEAIVRAAERIREPSPINVCGSEELSIRALAEMIAELAGYRGRIAWDQSRPDGPMKRSLDPSRARTALGWSAATSLRDGLARTVAWYRDRR